MANKVSSPYSASFTGCSFMFSEFNTILPILMDKNAEANIKQEIQQRKHLKVNTETAASRVLAEFKKRYKAVPKAFWEWYTTLGEQAQKAALLYVLLKAYRLLFEFHTGVTVRKWHSVNRTLGTNDIMSAYYEIAAKDEFVDSWSDQTRRKLVSSYITILCQSGMMDRETSVLSAIKLKPADYSWYLRNGEGWFLEACLLYPYEIDEIKKSL
jgi:hypothetical protein